MGAQESLGLRTKEHLQGKGTVAGALGSSGSRWDLLGSQAPTPPHSTSKLPGSSLAPSSGFSAGCFLHRRERILCFGERGATSVSLRKPRVQGPQLIYWQVAREAALVLREPRGGVPFLPPFQNEDFLPAADEGKAGKKGALDASPHPTSSRKPSWVRWDAGTPLGSPSSTACPGLGPLVLTVHHPRTGL